MTAGRHLQIVSDSPEDTRKLGVRIGEMALPGDVILLVGTLGTGKTCLTQGIAWGLGIREYAASPSFTIVRELHGRLPLYHMDLYRLDRPEEIADLGLDEYFYGQGISVIEWAEKAPGLLPAEHLLVRIDYVSDTSRRLRLEPHGRRYEALLAGLTAGASASGAGEAG